MTSSYGRIPPLSGADETLAEFISAPVTCIAVNQKTGETAVSYGPTDWEKTARNLAEELLKERDE